MRTNAEMMANAEKARDQGGLRQWLIEDLLEAPEEARADALYAGAYGETEEVRRQIVLEWIARLREMEKRRGKHPAVWRYGIRRRIDSPDALARFSGPTLAGDFFAVLSRS